MPSLPRIRRTRPRGFGEAVAPRPEPRVAEVSAQGLTWIHLDPPIDPETVNRLRERFGWHPLDVEDVLSKRQRPKIDDYADEGYLFGVLHFPAYDKNVQRLNAGELDFFLGPDYLVTIPNVELLPVTRLFSRVQEDEQFRNQLFEKSSGRLLYEVLDDLFDNYKEVVEALEDTNESVISHRQNDILRILTIFSVILLPLTLISGIFGMNVLFPGEHTPAAFWAIVGLMVGVIAGMIAFFKYKRWL